jgi:Putative adhesin
MTTKTFILTAPIKLDGRIGHGAFHVTAVDGITEATVSLVARAERPKIVDLTTVELRGDTLHVTAPRQGGIFDLFGGRTRDAIDVAVTVPSGTPVKIASFTADVTLTGRCGPADLASGAAAINAEQVDGDLRLRYGNGDCHVARVTGSVQLRSGSGTARFGEVGGALTAACGSGRLEVGDVQGVVRFRAGSGGATLESIHESVDLACGSGEIRIGLPAGVSAKLDLTTGSGQVDPQLPVSATSAGGRAITIRARTGSGDVHLFRAARSLTA